MATIRTKIIDILDAHKIPYRLLQHSEPVFHRRGGGSSRGVSKDEMVNLSCFVTKMRHYIMACVLGYARVNRRLCVLCPPSMETLEFCHGGGNFVCDRLRPRCRCTVGAS